MQAPIAEELVFRALCAPLLLLAGFSRAAIVLGCPLFFGLGASRAHRCWAEDPPSHLSSTRYLCADATAHVHRVRDVYRRSVLYGKREDHLRAAILQTAFQAVYTTVFGWYCAFVFLRTGTPSRTMPRETRAGMSSTMRPARHRLLACAAGHLIAPILCHTFANMMGVPPFDRALGHARQYGASESVCTVAHGALP